MLRQGVEAWNVWRANHLRSWPDFRKTDLHGLNLSRADFHHAQFSRTNLSGTNLSGANLAKADLWGTNLTGADLSAVEMPEGSLSGSELCGADLTDAALIDASLRSANLTRANLAGAILNKANLTKARLTGANFTRVDLREADLTEANFEDCNLTEAMFCRTVLSRAQIHRARALENIEHWGPSFVDVNTILSQEKPLPEVFLYGIGLGDEFIEYLWTRLPRPVEFHSCFISHAPADEEFADRLHRDLQAAGIRCWKWKCKNEERWRISPAIYYHIGEHDKLVVIASEASLKNGELLYVVRNAVYQEAKLSPGSLVFFPIALDASWKNWKPELVVNNYWKFAVIELKGHFSNRRVADANGWDKDPALYKRVVSELIEDLMKK